MARCEYHSWGSTRGRPRSSCPECLDANEKAAQAKAEALEARAKKASSLTRALGRAAVQTAYENKKARIKEAWRKAKDEIEERHKAIMAADPELTRAVESVRTLEAQLQAAHNEVARIRAPFEAAYTKERTSGFRNILQEPLDEAQREYLAQLENLGMRCHYVTATGKECGKYLDYMGRCPRHGELEAPGSA